MSKITALVAVVIILVAAGVGVYYYATTPGPTSSTTSTSQSTSVTTSTGPKTLPQSECPITIGGAFSLTGAYSTYGPRQLLSAQMAINETNASGGLLGCQVKLIYYDDQSDVKVVYNDYVRLITVDKVDLVMGSVISALGQAIAPLFEQYKIPVIHPAVAALPKGSQYSYSLLPYAGNYTQSYLDYMKQNMQNPTVAIISDSTSFPLTVANGANNYSKTIGLNVVDFEQFAPTTTDFTSLLSKLRSLNPDILIGTGYVNEAIQLSTTMGGLGWKPKAFMFTTGPSLPQYLSAVGSLANGVWTVVPWMPYPYLTSPGVQSYTETFQRKMNSTPDYTAMADYVTIKLIIQGVQSVGLDNAALGNYFSRVDTVIAGWPIRFSPVSHQNAAGMDIIQIQNGKWVVTWPPSVATGTGQFS